MLKPRDDSLPRKRGGLLPFEEAYLLALATADMAHKLAQQAHARNGASTEARQASLDAYTAALHTAFTAREDAASLVC